MSEKPLEARKDDTEDFAAQQIESGNKSIEKRLEFDNGKDADPVIDNMVKTSIGDLRKSIEESDIGNKGAELDKFDTRVKELTDEKSEFQIAKNDIMKSGDTPESKRSQLTMLYTNLKVELKKAQGEALVFPAKAEEQTQKNQQEVAKKEKDASEKFRQEFLAALTKTTIETETRKQRERLRQMENIVRKDPEGAGLPWNKAKTEAAQKSLAGFP